MLRGGRCWNYSHAAISSLAPCIIPARPIVSCRDNAAQKTLVNIVNLNQWKLKLKLQLVEYTTCQYTCTYPFTKEEVSWKRMRGRQSKWDIVTSSNGNTFRVTGPLPEESTGHRQIPLTRARDAELYFLWSAPERMIEQTIDMPVIWDAIALILTSL